MTTAATTFPRDTDGHAWLALVPFPSGETRALAKRLEAASGRNVVFFLLEDLENPDTLAAIEAHPESLHVLDALHVPDATTVTASLKLLLRHFPGRSFVVLAGEPCRRLDIPDYLGTGRVLVVDAQGFPLEGPGARAPGDGDDRELLRYARKVVPRYRAEHLVLGDRAQIKFDEVLAYLRTRDAVDTRWGFLETHSRGHGVTVLFHGPSGTGKTMAAEVLAAETGRLLYHVDVAAVTSKWIGETEKNLRTVFRAAENVHGVLLFDEGDALFGQRTAIQGSNDRHANAEVNALLQELEAFRGIAVLSTNHEQNLDEAFLRRFTFAQPFSSPTAVLRERIWRSALPAKLPLASDVDFAQLAQFSLTGGNIRNCVRHAAARAMGDAAVAVRQVDFLWAVKRELQKYRLELPRELVGESFWRQVAPEWEARPRRLPVAPGS